MSYLIITGTGRNNIAYGGGKSTKAKYLRRTGTGRTNISWIDISSNSTINVLERTGTGRNNIRWYNTTFSFGPSNLSEFGLTNGDINTVRIAWSTYNNNTYAMSYDIYAPFNISGLSLTGDLDDRGNHGNGPAVLVYAPSTNDDLRSYESIYRKITGFKITYYDSKKGTNCTNEYTVSSMRIGDTAGRYHNYIDMDLSVKHIGGSTSGYATPKEVTLTFVC